MHTTEHKQYKMRNLPQLSLNAKTENTAYNFSNHCYWDNYLCYATTFYNSFEYYEILWMSIW